MNKFKKTNAYINWTVIICFIGIFFILPLALAESKKIDYPGYPSEFTLVGKVDKIEDAYIIMDDSKWMLTSFCTFNKPNELKTSKTVITAGSLVGLILNPNGEVTSVWLLPSKN